VRFINFIFIFHMVFFSFAHWRFVFSRPKIRRTVYGIFRVLLGRTFLFGLRTKNLENLKKLFLTQVFSSPAWVIIRHMVYYTSVDRSALNSIISIYCTVDLLYNLFLQRIQQLTRFRLTAMFYFVLTRHVLF